jgi:hypothetical protein
MLLDRAHASIVEVVARTLTSLGWEVLAEFSFNHFGERGSVDLVAWYPLTRALLVVEVKSLIVDLQDLFMALGRKVRVVPGLLRTERGWNAAAVSRVLVLPGTTANRTVLARHGASFAASLPSRSQAVKQWLRAPVGPIAGVWFISPSRVATARQAVRVRMAKRKVQRPAIRAGAAPVGAPRTAQLALEPQHEYVTSSRSQSTYTSRAANGNCGCAGGPAETLASPTVG